jgi:hypothetical protein
MLKEPAAVLVDIIRQYMGLDNEHIWQYNSLKVIPNNKDLYVVVHYLTSAPYSNNSKLVVDNEVDPPVATETITTQTKEYYTIEIASGIARTAISRKEEIVAALKGAYSQQKQYENAFRIFPLSNRIINVSRQEGGSMLNRFMIDIAVLATYETSREVSYYDNFPYTFTSNP